MKAFASKGLSEIRANIIEVCSIVGACLYIVIRSHFSLSQIYRNRWENLFILTIGVALFVVAHSFFTAYEVSREVNKEQVDSFLLAQISLGSERSYSYAKAKLYGMAVFLSCLAAGSSFGVWNLYERYGPTFIAKVYVSEKYRIELHRLFAKNQLELPSAISREINGTRPAHYVIPSTKDSTVLNVIVRNIGNTPLKSGRISILTSNPVESKTAECKPFSATQINLDVKDLKPFVEPTGDELYCSLQFATTDPRLMMIFQVNIEGEEIETWLFLRAVLIEKNDRMLMQHPAP